MPTYTLDGVVQNAADSATGWSAGGTDTDSKIEGSACIGAKSGAGLTRFNHLGTARNFSAGAGEEGDHVIVWFNFLTFANLDTLANGGVRLFVGNDAGTNFKEFYITGLGNGYFGGWVAAIADPNATADNSAGTPDNTAFDAFGITYNATAGIMGNFNNGLVDQIVIGKGLQVTGTAGTFDGFLDFDEGTNIYGFVARRDGIVLSQCKFFMGDGTTTSDFTDINETIVFLDRPVASDFYEILIDTDMTCTFGAITSGVTSGGCSFNSAGTSKYALTVTEGGTVEAIANFYASTFNNYRIALLNPSTTVQDSIFSNGGQITLNGASITASTITASTVGADIGCLLLDNNTEWGGATPVVSDCFFSNNSANVNSGAIEISATGTYEFSNLTFDGNSFDIINSSGGLVTINVVGGDTPSVRNLTTSTTTINNSVALKITGVTEGTACKMVANETVGTITVGDVIFEGLADSAGEVSSSINYEAAFNPSGLDVIARSRNSGYPLAAIQDDNTSFTDFTTESNSSVVDDVEPFPAVPVAGSDFFFVGHAEQFRQMKVDISTVGVGSYTISLEYWNGSSYTALSNVVDGTTDFKTSGESVIEFDLPGDWATESVNSQGPYYYVRIGQAATFSTSPKIRQIKLDVNRYLAFDQFNTITTEGLSVTASWIRDRIATF